MNNNLILKRFFSKSMMHDLLSGKESSTFNCVVRRYVKDPDGKNYEKLISEIYSYMGKEYRTEYYYKNTMLNKLLFKRHDYKRTIALTEVPIGKSKADFVMINGKGVVYEIKTELDNLERVDCQVDDYYKAFTNVVIVTYQENIEKVDKCVPENVGLMVLTKRNALKMIREPKQDYSLLNYETIFKILRKKEFENIILKYNMELPIVSQFEYYRECLKLVKSIDIKLLQKELLLQVKGRMRIETVEFSLNVPSELRFLIYFDDLKVSHCQQFDLVMNRNFGG